MATEKTIIHFLRESYQKEKIPTLAKRQLFSSKIATILTLIGVAVGLGNVWRFPYMMGKYGGSAFLIIYLIFTILFALPALMAEIGLGRAGRKGPIGTFQEAFGKRIGTIIGYILMTTICIAGSYYVIVIANVLFSAAFSAIYSFQGTEKITTYNHYLGNGWLQYGISLLIIFISLIIIQRGLRKGIESISKIVVPFFLLAIVYLIFNAFSLDGATEKVYAFLHPDFEALEAQHIFAALGQAFYSLSLGGTFMLIYGSYLPEEEKIPQVAFFTSIGDVGAALLASLFIVPTVLVFGLDMTAGPTLIFSTMPHLFSQMAGGQVIGTLFLLALGLVALLSLIASYEVLSSGMEDIGQLNWSKKQKIIAIGIVQAILAFPSAFDNNLIGFLDLIFGSGMQLLGSGLAVCGLAWGLGKITTNQQIFRNQASSLKRIYHFWISWIIPFVLLVVLIGYIYNSI